MLAVKSAMTASGEYEPGYVDLLLADECSQFYADPLGFVMWAFDWDHGELEGFEGPDQWQRERAILTADKWFASFVEYGNTGHGQLATISDDRAELFERFDRHSF